jgi:CheY-like chemotaxis protein
VKRILVVDDDPAMTLLTRLRLEATGIYEVFTENRSSRAVAVARECRPDLVILDVMMPDMLGNDVAEALCLDPLLKHIKVVFLTSMVKRGEERRSGLAIVMAKPIDAGELIAVVERELAPKTVEPALSDLPER